MIKKKITTFPRWNRKRHLYDDVGSQAKREDRASRCPQELPRGV